MNEWVCCCRVGDLQFGADSAFHIAVICLQCNQVHASFQQIMQAQISAKSMCIDLLLKAVSYVKNKRSDCAVDHLCLWRLDVADKSISFALPAQLSACSIAFSLVCPCKQADEQSPHAGTGS